MRQLFILIVLIAVGYLGYTVYVDRLPQKEETPPASAPASTEGQATPPGTIPAPDSKSTIPDAASEKHLAPPGVFYMVDRVSAETKDGVIAVVPGDQVKLLKRQADGKLKVTIGTVDFEVNELQVTNDLDVAREAERKEFLKRGGRR